MTPSNAAASLAGLPIVELFNWTAPLVKLSDAGDGPIITAWSVPGVPEPTEEEWAAALAAPDPAPSLAQLQAEVIAAAQSSADSITTQIAPDSTHQLAYLNAAAMVWSANGAAPTSGPSAAIFAAYAADFGVSPAVLAARVLAGSAGSIALSGALVALQGAASVATTSAGLAAALATFEAALSGIVANLTAPGLLVVAPPAISIPGVNA